ncbi:MAG TPA: nucleotide exchange factor GrpE [Bacillota bacterium]|nr:nucleotide exchange factor GrpE [Bacillota bacterium]
MENENLQENEVERETEINVDHNTEEATDEVNTTQEKRQLEEDEEKKAEISVEQLTEEIEQIKQEKAELYDRMVRIQAEYENYKRRSLKERSEERKYKAQDLANELLPVLDNFERALQVETNEGNKQLYEGISMVYNQFKEALATQGIEEIVAEGEPFDPNLHHAVMQVEDESKESNIVVEELQKGYKLNDRVIRPTMVKVNK